MPLTVQAFAGVARSRRIPIAIVLVAASIVRVAEAQVAVEAEFLHVGETLAVQSCVEVPGVGFYAGAAQYGSNGSPSPIYLPRVPVLLRLATDGSLLGAHAVPIGWSSFPEPVLVAADAQQRAFLAFGHQGSVRVDAFAPDGAPLWSGTVSGAGRAVAGTLGVAPSGDVLVAVPRVVGATMSVAIVGFSPSGAPLYDTTISGGPSAALIGAFDPGAGRIATHSSTQILVADAGGALAWSQPLAFAPTAMAFGPGGELAVAGTGGSTGALLAVYEAGGAPRFTREAPFPGANPVWRAVAVDRHGAFALAGALGIGDARDGLAALVAADGTPAWHGVWPGAAGYSDAFERVAFRASGDVLVAGTSHENPIQPYYEARPRLVVAALDRPTGTPRWTHADPGTGTELETSASVHESADGAVVSAGGRWAQMFVNPSYRPIGAHVLVLRPQSSAFCFGDEPAAPCPCGNASVSGAQAGCANSTGAAARLVDGGIASLAADTLTLSVAGTTPTAPGLYFQGALAAAPAPFGDGLRCAGGTLTRLYTKPAAGGASSVPGPLDPSLSARSAAAGDVLLPGSTRVYQVAYRDLAASFCPPPAGANQNASNAVAVTWGV